jgi:hypothetical protein
MQPTRALIAAPGPRPTRQAPGSGWQTPVWVPGLYESNLLDFEVLQPARRKTWLKLGHTGVDTPGSSNSNANRRQRERAAMSRKGLNDPGHQSEETNQLAEADVVTGPRERRKTGRGVVYSPPVIIKLRKPNHQPSMMPKGEGYRAVPARKRKLPEAAFPDLFLRRAEASTTRPFLWAGSGVLEIERARG